MRLTGPVIAIGAALLLVGCGDGQSSTTGSTESSTVAAGAPEAGSQPAGAKKADSKPRQQVNREPLVAKRPKPHVTSRGDSPPKKHVMIRDLKEGEGEVAHRGDLLTVDFLGAYYETGEELMSSWERHEPFTFRLGGGDGILGWEHALDGMRVGGRRELVLPAHLTSRYLAPSEERSQIYVIDLRRVE